MRDAAEVRVSRHGLVSRFVLVEAETLGAGQVDELLERSSELGELDGVIVKFHRASKDAKARMAAHGISWLGPNGELRIDSRTMYIERGPTRRPESVRGDRRSSLFSKRGSRIVRWLLNNATVEANIRTLSYETGVSEATASRVVHELLAQRFVESLEHPGDNRQRRVRLIDGVRLLDRWTEWNEFRPARLIHWQIGASSIGHAASIVDDAAEAGTRQDLEDPAPLNWCVGGLAGVDSVIHAVVPQNLMIWIELEDLPQWRSQLMPSDISRPGGPGTLTLGLATDDYLFTLARRSAAATWSVARTPIADKAQLYLDCARLGERGLEAALAVRQTMDLPELP